MVNASIKQIWVVSGVLLNMISQGMVLSYPSCLLPALLAPDSEIKVDLNTASWLASCLGPSGIPGLLLSSLLMDWKGRKFTHVVVILPGMTGWLFIYFATDIASLMVGRLLCGVSAGGSVVLGAVVIGEYTSPKNRGIFLNLKTALICVASTIVHVLGHFLQWRTVALLALIPNVLCLIVTCTWPDSPAWLASKKRFVSSEKAFNWLRGDDPESRRELGELIRAQEENVLRVEDANYIQKIKAFFHKFRRRDFVKPAIIIVLCAILLESCGRHIFPAYALKFIGAITGDNSQSFYYTLTIDIIITASSLFSSFLIKIFKRRTLLFVTGLSSLFVLLCACSYLSFATNGIISRSYPWIPISLLLLYFILANLGCTPISLALLGEIFPLEHRAAGSIVAGITISVSLMLGLHVTPYLLENVEVHGTFAVFGSITGFTLAVLYYTLPETKDRTLQEIEDYFKFGRYKERGDDEDTRTKMLN